MGTIDVTISPSSLGYLASLVEGDRDRNFIFLALERDEKPAKSDLDNMVKLGLVTKDGKITDKALPTMTRLARARSFAHVYDMRGIVLDAAVYFDMKVPASITPRKNNLRIIDPAPVDSILSLLELHIGSSPLCTVDLDVTMSAEEALSFCALIDLFKRQILTGILDAPESEPVPATAEAILKLLADGIDKPQLISPLIKSFIGTGESPSSAQVEKALSKFAKDGLIKREKNGYSAGEITGLLADRFVLIENLFSVEAGHVSDDNTVGQIRFEVVKSGFSDLLMWEMTDNREVNLLTLPPFLVMTTLSRLFTSDDSLSKTMTKLPKDAKKKKVPTKAGGPSCAKCGQPIPPASKFCNSCGAPIVIEAAPAEISCPKCGRKLPQGAKFCGKCGTSL